MEVGVGLCFYAWPRPDFEEIKVVVYRSFVDYQSRVDINCGSNKGRIVLTSVVGWSFNGATDSGAIFRQSECDSSCWESGLYSRTKHINVRGFFLMLEEERSKIKLLKVGTSDNPSDMMTKSLPKDKFEHCSNLISLLPVTWALWGAGPNNFYVDCWRWVNEEILPYLNQGGVLKLMIQIFVEKERLIVNHVTGSYME